MVDKARRVVRKYYEFIITRVKLIFLQKKYIKGDVTLKYILKKYKDSDKLVVVFSSCTRRGLKARYNYMRTLEGIKANRLFILDDFAADKRGSYYMGPNFTFEEEKATLSLIEHIREELSVKDIICCGSSKGGYSALNFGLQIPYSKIVVGAPQYFLSTYLHSSNNMECLRHIMGEFTEEKEKFLNDYLSKRIREDADKYTHTIYIHFSNKEHTYEEHVKYLLEELNKQGYAVNCDIADYTNHSDISYHFPDFLKKTVRKLTE